jgi:diacylglycerol O-acyltransferase
MADYEQRMLHTDAFSWYMESDPALRSTVVAVAVLDRAPDWEHLKHRVDRMTRLVPRFRQRVEEPPMRLGPPRWVIDADFDIDWHMRRMRLPRGADWAAALEVARIAAMDDFDRDRPLWEVTALEGLPRGQVALITKMHHALSDGVGAIQLMAYFVDFSRELPELEELPPVPVEPPMTAFGMVASSVRDDALEAVRNVGRAAGLVWRAPQLLLDPVGTSTGIVATAASVARIIRPVMRNASPVMTERTAVRRLATLDVPLEGLKQAARPSGGHLNDAFVAGITGGLRRYHDAHGTTAEDLRVTMPVSIRKPDDPIGGNRITLLRFAVPVGLADAAARIARTAAITRAWQHEPGIAHTQGIAFGLNLAPRSYIQGILRRIEFVASDVPGLTQPVYVAGARVVAYYPFGPTIGAAMNATLMSYAGTCNIGINIDTGAVPDAEELVAHLRDGFDEVLALAPTAGGVAAAG